MATTQTQGAARATVRYLRTSPYKVRQVLELVRGLPVEDAERLLRLCEKDAADDVLKLLTSAAANAESNHALEADELYIARAWADEGPTRKWGQPRARGRYFRVRKRTSHVTIILERFDADELEERQRRQEVTGRGAATQQRRRAERVRRSRASQEDALEEEVPEASIEEEELEAAEGGYVDVDEALAEAEAEEIIAEADEAAAEDEEEEK
ncbi:MAG TPA: 50S ribosomal protein L22 [Acidimicrobiia bacterium]|jgi:large subunit ribosomal protein L22|nr:50S ribosomal protein L22 [Acidimicrobiia bacterium]